MSVEENRAKNKKTLKIIGGVVLGIIILIVLIASLGGGDTKKTTADQKPKADLATRVDKDLKENLGVKAYTDSTGDFVYINGIKATGDGDVEVTLQEDCDKQTASATSRQIMGLVGGDVKDLSTVYVKCLNNTYQYTNRDSVFTE